MKPEELKLYQKYKYEYIPNIKYIFIGKGNNNLYWFFYKDKFFDLNINYLNYCGLNSEQISKNLNLKTYIKNNHEYIKGYGCFSFNKEELIYFKPILKEKLKNIINR